MKKITNLQEIILNCARVEGIPVTVFLTNGFQLRGKVEGFDAFTVILDSDGKQQLIYKHAISTIIPARAIPFTELAQKEEGQQ
jgi:host factor-I protein